MSLSVCEHFSSDKFHCSFLFLFLRYACYASFYFISLSVRCALQLTGGSSCERRRVHCTKMNCSALLKNLGVIVFSASQTKSIQEGTRPGPALSPWFCALLHLEVCPSLRTSQKQVWRPSLRMTPAPGGSVLTCLLTRPLCGASAQS